MKPTPVGERADASQDADASRRRFLKLGLITGPMVLTLASRPAAAMVGPSVGLSGNVSTFGENPPQLQGEAPSFWINDAKAINQGGTNASNWSASLHGPTDKFSTVFDYLPFNDTTLLDVLKFDNSTSHKSLAREAVAAFLNASHAQIFYRFGAGTVINLYNGTIDGNSGFSVTELYAIFAQENGRGSPI
jgi:hypothetical protein